MLTFTQAPVHDVRSQMFKNHVDLAGIPPRYDEAHLERSCAKYAEMDGKAFAYSVARTFSKHGFRIDRGGRRYALFLGGALGRGKTWLATACLKQMIWNALSGGNTLARVEHAIWIKFHSLIREVQACYNPGATRSTHEVITRYQRCPLLLIDDIGDFEARGETEDRRRILYEVIDYRNDHMLPTIMTSNLTLDQLEEHYGQRSMQRFLELSSFVLMEGENLREEPQPEMAN